MMYVRIRDYIWECDVAKGNFDLQRGLGGRISIPRQTGLLFIYPFQSIQTFWMKGMQFPIDIICMNSNQEVVEIFRNVQHEPGVPDSDLNRYTTHLPIQYALEVNAGEARDVKKGDKGLAIDIDSLESYEN